MTVLASSKGLRFRWINGQCFEFRFPNGKTLLTDPWYTKGETKYARRCPENFTTENVKGADYVFISHGHFDHTADLQDVLDKFHPTLITHTGIAMELAKSFRFPLTSLYPVDFNGRYYFDGFTLDTYHGTHHHLRYDYQGTLDWFSGMSETCGSLDLNAMGAFFNTNFIITTDQGLRIAFLGGNDDGMIERMKQIGKPNVVIRNKLAGSDAKEGQKEMFADWFAGADVQLLIPMHHEAWLTDDPAYAEDMFSYMNQTMEEKNMVGRVAPMKRGRWYDLCLAVAEAEDE